MFSVGLLRGTVENDLNIFFIFDNHYKLKEKICMHDVYTYIVFNAVQTIHRIHMHWM